MNASADLLVKQHAASQAVEASDFAALYRQNFDFVWRSLRRLGVRPAVVEDAVQDTFVVLHRRLGDLRPEVSLRSFLFAITLRIARDYRRTAQRKGTEAIDLETTHSREAGPFDRTATAEAARVLERFLDSLDEAKRAVFAAAELEGMTAPEISEALSMPINTVYSRLRVARQRFVAFLVATGGRRG
jgi:RNA polymerase sigma-70 factor (ECF subfamily)